MRQENITITLDDMLQRERIRHNSARYVRGMDRQDADLIKSTYWPEGWDDHGLFIGSGDGFAEWMRPVWPTMRMDHHLGQSYIELHGNIANAETYFVAYHRTGKEDEQTQDMFLGGRYLDRLERRGDDWKFINRFAIYDWYRKLGDSDSWRDPWWANMDLESRTMGKQDKDFSWEVFANGPLEMGEVLDKHNAVTKPKA